METISFVRTREEIQNTWKLDPLYRCSEGLFMSWDIDPALFRRVLPYGLEMENPTVTVMVINHNHPGFHAKPYTVGIIGMACHYHDICGTYPIGFVGQVPDHDDMTIFFGREQYGYPKKTGETHLERTGSTVSAFVKRHGVDIFKADALITNEVPQDAERFFPEAEWNSPTVGAEFHLKYNRECYGHTRNPFESMVYEDPKLVHTEVETTVRKEERAVATVEFQSSADDPWIELSPAGKRVHAIYRTFDCALMSNVLDRRYEKREFDQILPYLFTNSDYQIFSG